MNNILVIYSMFKDVIDVDTYLYSKSQNKSRLIKIKSICSIFFFFFEVHGVMFRYKLCLESGFYVKVEKLKYVLDHNKKNIISIVFMFLFVLQVVFDVAKRAFAFAFL